jgi:hypothetical protein
MFVTAGVRKPSQKPTSKAATCFGRFAGFRMYSSRRAGETPHSIECRGRLIGMAPVFENVSERSIIVGQTHHASTARRRWPRLHNLHAVAGKAIADWPLARIGPALRELIYFDGNQKSPLPEGKP